MPDRRHDGEADRSWIELLRCSRTSDPTAIFAARMLGNFLRLGSRRAWEMHANLPGKLGDETVIDLGLPSATAVTLAFAPFGVFKALGLGLFDGFRLDQHTLAFIAFSRRAPLDHHSAKTRML